MLGKILTNKISIISARILKNSLEEILGRELIVSTKDYENPVVRYGNSLGKDNGCLNTPEFIKLTSNKKLFSNLMLENEIHSPVFFQQDEFPEEFPIIIRKTLTSSKGRGIIFCENEEIFEENYEENYYWTPYVYMSFELRTHVLGGEIKRIFKKIPDDENNPIKNNGVCKFSLRENIKIYRKLFDIQEKLNEVLGINNFYALDVGWDVERRKYFILEANSAPGINDNTSKIYAEFLTSRIEEVK